MPRNILIIFLFLTFSILFLGSALVYVLLVYPETKKEPTVVTVSSITELKEIKKEPLKQITGTVKTGEELGITYCRAGLYLTDGENASLMLREKDPENYSKMLTDRLLIGKQITVIGKYPAQENFCMALMCDCEDYLLIESLRHL